MDKFYDMKKLLLSIILMLASLSAFSQSLDKLEFGGSLGMNFGDYTSVTIAPMVGYRFHPMFSAGGGLGYSYYKYDKYNVVDKEHTLSLNTYARFYPVQFIVLSLQPSIGRTWYTQERNGQKFSDNKFVPTVVVGGGLRLGNMTAQIMYDVVQDKYSPYGNKIFYSVGYVFSL